MTTKSKPGEVANAVKDAIDAGYHHIDCAMVYENEQEVGEGLKAKFEDGTIKRSDIFITSKLWCNFHSKGAVLPALKKSLADLGLEYVDLYLMHWPMGYKEGGVFFPKDEAGKFFYSDVDYLETWLAMEEAVKLGLAKSIGLSNFNKAQIERIIENGTITPANHQIECHPHLAQKKMIKFCKSKGISVTAYSPLGSPARPYAKPDDPVLPELPTIVNIAKKYNKSPGQILIAFQLQRGLICIPKSVTKSRIQENLKVFDFKLSPEDIATLESMDCNSRICPMDMNADNKDWPFHDEY